nr:PREDICTED: uncharacterized protein LOC108226048 [Daucus carota subsp. sativus]
MANRNTYSEMQNPLYLHPSDGPMTVSVAKLTGSSDYRTWKRSIEIQLATKRKLGFVTGELVRNTTDVIESEQWETCNNLVISWIHNSVSDSIRKSILFFNNASEIWLILENRFAVTNGSRKYKLTKDLFAVHQDKLSVVDFYTNLSSIWDEIEAMNMLPVLEYPTPEIHKLLDVLNTQKEESKLFYFLNGLNESYSALRSQLLMTNPLPSVEAACSVIQQEEHQREVLKLSCDDEISAMYSKGVTAVSDKSGGDKAVLCTNCHKKGHSVDKCWFKIGFPDWYNKNSKKPGSKFISGGNKRQVQKYSSNNAIQQNDVRNSDSGVNLTASQLAQLLKLLPRSSKEQEIDDEFESFSGMVTCNAVQNKNSQWIMDSGASDHMTSSLEHLINVVPVDTVSTITLPTGDVTVITHVGDLVLSSGLKLNRVLYVPQFQHNFLSIHKLAAENKCNVKFYQDHCEIFDDITGIARATGHLVNGLYYLSDVNKPSVSANAAE